MLNFVSTPIGNLNDISLRAVDVIRSSDYLYAEDTRNIKKLLNFININAKSKSFHEHNEHKVSIEIIEKLKNGKIVTVVSDAGTPAISDPGYKLIQMCIKDNIRYTLIPGSSSVISALVMSGLPTDRFSFYGFVPRKANDQDKFFEILSNDDKTSIFFESPKRIEKTLLKMKKFVGEDRNVSLCKEMTKIHENVFRGRVFEILERIKKVIENQLGIEPDDIKLESTFFEDLDADSLDIVELILTFEEAFKVDISDEAAAEMSSVQDVFNFVKKILAEKG